MFRALMLIESLKVGFLLIGVGARSSMTIMFLHAWI
jgi:hypothetical protein